MQNIALHTDSKHEKASNRENFSKAPGERRLGGRVWGGRISVFIVFNGALRSERIFAYFSKFRVALFGSILYKLAVILLFSLLDAKT